MLSQRRMSLIRSLHRKRERRRQKLFLVEGLKPVRELLKEEWDVRFIAGLPELFKELGGRAKECELIECDRESIEACSSLHHPEGILAVVDMPEFSFEIDRLCSDRPLLCGENLQDPGNLGTFLRIADHFDLGDLLFSTDSVDPYNPKVVRSSMGSLFRQRAHRKELLRRIDDLQKEGRRVVATCANGPSVYSHPLPKDCVLLFGSESRGLSDRLYGIADETRSLPALGRVESLNVAVSAAIFCSEILREEMP